MGEFLSKYGTMIISLLGLVYTIFLNIVTSKANKETKRINEKTANIKETTERIQREIEKVQLGTLQASQLYINIKKARSRFNDSMANLSISMKNNSEDLEKNFLITYNRYIDFFNEINDFCIMIKMGAIKADDYINTTISKNFTIYASFQVDMFNELQEITKSYKLKPIEKPSHNAFKEYDEFLKEKNGGEDSGFWTKLKTDRKRVGFE